MSKHTEYLVIGLLALILANVTDGWISGAWHLAAIVILGFAAFGRGGAA